MSISTNKDNRESLLFRMADTMINHRLIGRTLLALFALSICSQTATAAIIREYTAGTIARIEQYPGISFLTPTGGPWGDITFSWFVPENGAPRPAAFGTIFLLTNLYTGTPSELNAFTDGYLAEAKANASGTEYEFDPSVTLHPNTTYYFYANSFNLIYGGGLDPGAVLYSTTSGNTKYVTFMTVSPNYRLSGDPIEPREIVPEPSSILLLTSAIAAFTSFARQRSIHSQKRSRN